jgi:hypothetical protein
MVDQHAKVFCNKPVLGKQTKDGRWFINCSNAMNDRSCNQKMFAFVKVDYS